MRIQQHPSEQLEKDWIYTIESNAQQAEAAGQLQELQLQLAYERQWFTMLVPKQYGGLELALPAVVRLEEAIAWADGSMGWAVTLCAGAGWFGGFMLPSLATPIFRNADACLAGSGAATGTAEVISGGYRVSGKWMHASGAPHNTVFTANCVLTQDGAALTDSSGHSLVKPFAFFRDEVNIIHTWNAFGLIATASHAFEIKELEVPAERCFSLEEGAALIDTPLYRYPFLQLAEVTLAANISGIAIRFLDAAAESVPFKRATEQPILEQVITAATAALESIRRGFYAAVDLSWQQLEEQQSIAPETLQQLSILARALAEQSRRSTDEVYPYCGLDAAAKDSVLNRVWRDLHTASQHSLLVFPRN